MKNVFCSLTLATYAQADAEQLCRCEIVQDGERSTVFPAHANERSGEMRPGLFSGALLPLHNGRRSIHGFERKRLLAQSAQRSSSKMPRFTRKRSLSTKGAVKGTKTGISPFANRYDKP